MSWEFKGDRPIYLQLIEQIELRIISGLYKSGDKLPSVRDMASEASVNPNTMQKALTELERTGLVYSQRTSGRFITDDISKIKAAQKDIARDKSQNFLETMKKIGFNKQDTIKILEELEEDNNA
ncbi:MAG: GntR family transcriptional regulator [Clostridium sp.]